MGHGDLTTTLGAPLSAGDPAGDVTDGDGSQHVVYRDESGHLHEMWWNAAGSGHGDLTSTSQAAAAASDP